MSDSQQTPWSNNPNAPKVSRSVYHYEKAYFAGFLISLVLYGMHKAPLPIHPSIRAHSVLGIVVVLFFRCIAALLNPIHRREERITWGLVSYAVVMFLLVTVGNAVHPYLQSISFINNRDFPGIEGVVDPGPLVYQLFVAPKVLGIVPSVSFTL